MSQSLEGQSSLHVSGGEAKEFTTSDEPKVALHDIEIDDLVTILCRDLFTQDGSRLREYSEIIPKQPHLCQTLVDIVLASRIIHEDPERDREAITAASNAISILNYGSRSGLFSFHFLDVRNWSGIRVPGANLNYAVMAHCNLSDADLSNSTMAQITLFKANLDRTNLTGVKKYELAALPIQPNPGTCEGPYNLTVHPNGTVFASAQSDGIIRIFSVETNEVTYQLSGHATWIKFLSFSRDGHYLASIGADNTARIWNLTTYQCKLVFNPRYSNFAFQSPITFSPDTTRITVVCNGVISVGNIEIPEWNETFHHDDVAGTEWSPCADRLLSYTRSGDMRIWDIATRSCAVRWEIPSSNAWAQAKFTLDGTKVVVSIESVLYLFDARTGDCVAKLSKRLPNNSAFALDRALLYATSRRWISVFDLETHQSVANFLDTSDASELFSTANGHKLFAYCPKSCLLRAFDTTLLKSPVPSLTGDGEKYFSLAFSSDNSHLVAANRGSDGNLRFLDVTTGHCTKAAAVLGYQTETYLLDCCPGGRFIAFVPLLSQEIFIYDTSKPTGVTRLNKHVSCVIYITFNTKGNLLASSAMNSDDHQSAGNILLWDTATWKSRVLRGHTESVTAMCFNPDGNMLASVSEDQTLRVWNVTTDKCIMVLGDRSTLYKSLSYSLCGRFLATADGSRRIRIWNMVDGECMMTFDDKSNHNQGMPGGVSFLRNDQLLSSHGTLRIYDIFTGECVDLGVDVTDPRHVLTRDCRLMATRVSSDTDNAVYLWRFPDDAWKSEIILEHVDTTKFLAHLHVTNLSLETREFAVVCGFDHDGAINLVTSTPQATISSKLPGSSDLATCLHMHGRYLVTGSHDTTVRLWDLETKQCSAVLEGHTCAVSCAQLSLDVRWIASGSQDTTIRLWDISESKCVGQFEGHTVAVNLIRFSPDNSLLASVGSGSNVVHIWDVAATSCSMLLNQHADEIFDIQFSAHGNYLGSASHDNAICVWEMKTGECVAVLKGHTNSLTCFVISSDGKIVVTGSEDTCIRIWNVTSGECNLIIKGHTGHVRSLCLTPDDRCVISASNDRVIQVWDITTGGLLHQLLGHTDAVVWLKLMQYDAQTMSTIISASFDGTLRVWMIDKMSSPRPYLPEIYGMVGAQEITE